MRNFYPHRIYWYFKDCQGFLGRVKIGFESVVLSVTTLEAFCPLPRSFRWFSFSHKTFSAVESITEYFAAWHESNFWEITQIFILCLQFNKTMVGFGESWKGSIHQFPRASICLNWPIRQLTLYQFQTLAMIGFKLLLYQTNPNWITHQQVNRQILRHIAQHELSAVWRFNGSNGSHRSLCWMQNPRQEQSDRSSSGWRWQRFMDRVMGKSQRELPVRNTITLLWPHFRKILSSF